MDTLKNKRYAQFDELSRYAGVPIYYDTVHKRDTMGQTAPMLKDAPYVSHKLTQEDTLDSLSLKYYGNPTFWWVIAKFNDITDPLIDLDTKYKILKIPNISSVSYGELR